MVDGDKFCDHENLLTMIQIARTRNIGPITFQKLLNKFKTPQAILREIEKIMSNKGNSSFIFSRENAEKEFEKTRAFGANIISLFDDKYPKLLKECEDPPVIISYIGDIEKISENAVGFVGARNCSANGVSLAYKFAKELAEKGISVVSGLAKGIDGASHKGALDAKTITAGFIPTIAVIGGGIDNIYPKENEELFKKVEDEGVIISEYPFGTKPKSENFPKRNRIISALTKAVLIVEATLKSGSLITARMALEQNREVMCIPGFPMDDRAKGCNKLIKDGAHIITHTDDIVEIVNGLKVEQLTFDYPSNFAEDYIPDIEDSDNETEILEVANQNTTSDNPNQDILDFISFSPIEIDQVIKLSGLSASKVNSLILENELTGELTRHPGNKVSKVG